MERWRVGELEMGDGEMEMERDGQRHSVNGSSTVTRSTSCVNYSIIQDIECTYLRYKYLSLPPLSLSVSLSLYLYLPLSTSPSLLSCYWFRHNSDLVNQCFPYLMWLLIGPPSVYHI